MSERFLAEGEAVGNFVVTRVLASGGMGAVYEARHSMTGKRVALKVMLPVENEDEASRKRFLREAQAACSVRHPAIATVHDLIVTSERLVLVMDLLEGEDLAEMIERLKAIEPAKAVELVLPIASAIGALHAQGFVHRDVKPNNVFVTREGPFLIDFGLVLDTRPGASRLTGAQVSYMGTPIYVAPEAIGTGKTDHRVDVWSLGIVLYEMLAGEAPTMAPSLPAVERRILFDDLPPIASVAASVPAELARLVDRMLAKDPNARLADMGEVYDALAPMAPEALLRRYGRPGSPGSDASPVRKTAEAATAAVARPSTPPARAASSPAIAATAPVSRPVPVAPTLAEKQTPQPVTLSPARVVSSPPAKSSAGLALALALSGVALLGAGGYFAFMLWGPKGDAGKPKVTAVASTQPTSATSSAAEAWETGAPMTTSWPSESSSANTSAVATEPASSSSGGASATPASPGARRSLVAGPHTPPAQTAPPPPAAPPPAATTQAPPPARPAPSILLPFPAN